MTSMPLADYFWIAGLDGQDILNAYTRQPNREGADGYRPADTIQEDAVAEQESTPRSDSPVARSHPGARDSYQRLSRLSDEAHMSVRSIYSNPIGSNSNRSSTTIRATQPAESRMSTALSEADFERALHTFTRDRDNFFLDLNFGESTQRQSDQPKLRHQTQKILAEDFQRGPSRAFGSIRRHISFKEMNSVKRQPSLARNGWSRPPVTDSLENVY